MERQVSRKHPGFIQRKELVEGRKLNISKIAQLLFTSRANLSNLFNGKSSLTANMALKIEKVFGGSSQHLMRLQSAFDLEIAKVQFNLNPLDIKKYIED